jgi:hypothetical protein
VSARRRRREDRYRRSGVALTRQDVENDIGVREHQATSTAGSPSLSTAVWIDHLPIAVVGAGKFTAQR